MVAAEVLVDPAPAFQQLIEGGVLPLGVGSPANLYSAGVAVQQAGHPVRQLVMVFGVGGDVVGGAGPLVAGGD